MLLKTVFVTLITSLQTYRLKDRNTSKMHLDFIRYLWNFLSGYQTGEETHFDLWSRKHCCHFKLLRMREI